MDALRGYEIAIDRVQRIQESRQESSQIYLAVNTAILGVLALLVKEAGFRGWGLVAVSVPLFIAGAMACLVWHKLVVDFRAAIAWHYQKLREIEKELPQSHMVCTEEWQELYQPRGGKERFGLSRREVWLPRLFIGLYAVYFVGLAAAAAAGWK